MLPRMWVPGFAGAGRGLPLAGGSPDPVTAHTKVCRGWKDRPFLWLHPSGRSGDRHWGATGRAATGRGVADVTGSPTEQ